MKEGKSEAIRNIALISYTGAGKTSLLEALLYSAGTIPAIGTIPAANTVSDYEPEEHHRKVSINLGVAHFQWKDTVFNLVDTPGALSFLGEAKSALNAVDGLVIVMGASSGMRTELERLWLSVQELELPCVLFVNELDKERTDPAPIVEEFEKTLEVKTVPVTIPTAAGPQLDGVIDLVGRSVFRPMKESSKLQQSPVPAELTDAVNAARKKLVEGVAETEDALLEKYLSEGDLTDEEIRKGLRIGTISRSFVPVLCGSATRNIGTSVLLDMLAACLPSPVERARTHAIRGIHPQTSEVATRHPVATEPFSGLIFKTIIDPFMGRMSYARVLSGTLQADAGFFNATRRVREKGGHLFTILGKKYTQAPEAAPGDIVAIGKLKDTLTGDTICEEAHPLIYTVLPVGRPVLSYALEPKSKADVEKVSLGLHKLVEEDPTLEFTRNNETKEMILSGMGQLHIDATFEKLKRKFGVDVNVHTPKVPYKETIRKLSQAQGKYKKQTGGHGQYGDCWLELAPLGRGKGFLFEDRVVGGVIPRNFIPAVEKGVMEALHEGILAGFPVVDLKVAVYDGSYHTVDSSEMSFKIAASMGFKKAMEQAQPILLEPIMSVEVVTPDDAVGAVIGDLNSRRGRIAGVTAKGNSQSIKALVPLAEMLKYAPALNAVTGGRGGYTMEFLTYEEVPRDLAPRIIEEQKAAKQTVAT